MQIRQRMLFVALMPALVISLTLALYFIVLRYNEADASLLDRGNALTRQLSSAAEYGAFSGNVAELQRLAEAAAHEPDVSAVGFFGHQGDLLVSVGNRRFADSVTALAGGWEGHSRDGDTLFFHARILHVTKPFDDPFAQNIDKVTSPLPLGSVMLEMSRSAVQKSKQEILIVTLLFSLGALAAGTLLAHRLSRDVTEPILALQKTVAEIHDGCLTARVVGHPAGTVRNLEDGINEMAGALQAGRDQLESRIAEATQELRQKKEEAERMNLAKTRFLAAASHDLRQPLTALSLFSSQLEKQPGNPAQRNLLQNISRAVEALNEQLNALLEISRLDLGDVVAHPATLALAPLIERVIAVHAPAAQAKDLCLRHVPTRAWSTSDPLLLERMLGNLLANAVNYTQSGGIVVGVRRDGADWRLEIWDSGIGIGREQLPMIFQEFYQVANPERAAEKGLGLGLATVARLAQILGHPLDVRSQPGRGTVFSISLPRVAAVKGAQAQAKGKLAFSDFDIDVLVFSVVCTERTSLRKLLEGWGCRTSCGTDAADSLPDVLIYDEDSLAAAAAFIESHRDRGNLPILIQLGETAGSQGGLAAHTKIALPLRPARLRALLQQLLQARAAD